MKRLSTAMVYIVMSLFVSEVSIAESGIKASSIAKAKVISSEKHIPIMLIFFDDDCDNCVAINDEFLKPMAISGDYQDKVVMVYVDTELDEINNFAKQSMTMDDFSGQYNVELLPTVSFVNHNGKELSESLSGVSNLEYYGSLIDEAIEEALKKLNSEQSLSSIR